MANLDFYARLPAFTDAAELADARHYHDLPEDWLLFATDVSGSTRAIVEGRYKQVNTIGAASIIAAQNACPGLEFPFVFGGDGATLAVPPERGREVGFALAFVREKAEKEFDLKLRVARITVREVIALGKQVRVAKLALSPGNAIAVFAGGGLTAAEKLLKTPGSGCELPPDMPVSGSAAGLECRWKPIPNARGEILTLIVEADPGRSEAERAAVYREILGELRGILAEARPIRTRKLAIQWPPRFFLDEIRMKYSGLGERLEAGVRLFFWMAVQAIWVSLHRKNPPANEPGKYLADLEKNIDHIKADDNLRMVLDVTPAESARISALFEKMRASRGIRYGLHSSPTALMTCFVQSSAQHIHFIDGGDGGYAMAAKQLKEQIRS